jgi:hypothetical protein
MKKTTSRLALTTSLISSLLAQGQLADEFKDGGNAAPQITKRSEAEEKVLALRQNLWAKLSDIRWPRSPLPPRLRRF